MANCTPMEFVLSLLTSAAEVTAKMNLIDNTACVLDAFSCVPAAAQAVRTWTHEAAKTLYMEQIRALTTPQSSFHFNTHKATLEQIKGFSLGRMESFMTEHAPEVSDLLLSLLTSDPELDRRRVDIPEENMNDPGAGAVGSAEDVAAGDEVYWSHFPAIEPQDLFEDELPIADVDLDSGTECNSAADGLTGKQHKWRLAAQRKCVAVCRVQRFATICILVVSTNQKCNALGGTLGFFLHSKNVPEKVIEVLHHLGISASTCSIYNAVNSLSQAAHK
ncbi:hypothetical protein K439DRAFT_1616043 [Ramaria rubella]|nr:hypothetical protein K439DRAFT_1616043 [Ramaria rubella]